MRTSTIWDKRWVRAVASAAFWLAVWQLAAWMLPQGSRWLIAGPVPTVQSLLSLAYTMEFWLSILHTLGKIALGFALAFVSGSTLAVLCVRFSVLRVLLEPAVQVMKSVPVACFVVVALIWMGSSSISILTAFFVVFPVLYIQLREGLNTADPKMLEMARVFRLSRMERMRAVWLPAAAPYVLSACRVTVGMALKAGIAGEIIGLPRCSIGEQLYLSKLYLDMSGLFAWSAVIIALSMALEKLLVCGVRAVQRKWGMEA